MKHIELQRVAPADIEARSMELIGQELGERVFPAEQLPVVKRVIHTTADFEYADSLVFSAGAVEAGVAAIRQGCTIVTDTQMAFSGVNKRVLEKFGGRAVCFMSDPDVAAEAKARGETRATVSMERAARLEGPLVLAIGNAPTALVRACELIGAGELKPALVIGVPVGFVNVVEQGAAAHPGRTLYRGPGAEGRQQRGRRHLQRHALSGQQQRAGITGGTHDDRESGSGGVLRHQPPGHPGEKHRGH